jgi:hypothetical protein
VNESTLRTLLAERAEAVDVGHAPIEHARRAAQRARRRRSTVGAGLCAIGFASAIGVAVAVHAFSGGRPSPASSSDDDRSMVTVKAGASDWGVYIGVDVVFDSARGLDDGYFQAGASRYQVQFWTEATDCDCEYPDPLPAHAGETVLIEATSAIPDCTIDPPDSIELVVNSRMPNGSSETNRFVVSNPDAYGKAVEEWCTGGVRVMTGNASVTLDGIAGVDLLVTNPGPHPIVVDVPEFSADGAHWEAASATVAPRETATLRLHGTGVRQSGGQPVPWEGGRLLVDGEPLRFDDPNSWI